MYECNMNVEVKDNKTILLKLKNNVGSGEATVNIQVFIDGQDVTDRSKLKIGNRDFNPITKNMNVYSFYGDDLIIKVELEEPLQPKKHEAKLRYEIISPIWLSDTCTKEFTI